MTTLGVPLIAVVMWMLTMDATVMGKHRNRPALDLFILVTIVWLVFLSVRQGLGFLGVP